MVRLTIDLPSKDGVFYPGDILRGTVVLHLNEPRKINGLYIKIVGKAETIWSTGSGKSHATHEGQEIYLDQKTYLHGHEGSPPVEIAAGTHRYNFEVLLPADLPPSVELNNGTIEYYVEGCMDIPWAFDEECKSKFKVVRKDDLNHLPQLKLPRSQEAVIGTTTCFSLSSTPLRASVSIPYSLYSPGSFIPITIVLNNRSDKKIKDTEIKLKQIRKVTSHVYLDYPLKGKEVEAVIAKITVPGIEKETYKTIDTRIQVPFDACPTLVSQCKIIDVTYMLQVNVHGNKSKFPIVISLVPNRISPQPSSRPRVEPIALDLDSLPSENVCA